MSRTRKQQTSIQLFPFLAVLMSMMGALNLMLLAITRQAEKSKRVAALTSTADPSAEPAALPPLPELAPYQPMEPLPPWTPPQFRIKTPPALPPLVDPRPQARRQVEEARLELERVLAAKRSINHPPQDRLEHLDRQLIDLRRRVDELQNQTRRAIEETGELLPKVVELKNRTTEIHRSDHQENQYAIIPYTGPNGTRRRPIYFECRKDGIVLQPEGTRLGPELFATEASSNALVELLQTLIKELNDDHGAGDPYPLFLVRPDGIAGFYIAQGALSRFSSPVGYELVAEGMELAFPEPNEKVRALAEKVIATQQAKTSSLAKGADFDRALLNEANPMPGTGRYSNASGGPKADGPREHAPAWGRGGGSAIGQGIAANGGSSFASSPNGPIRNGMAGGNASKPGDREGNPQRGGTGGAGSLTEGDLSEPGRASTPGGAGELAHGVEGPGGAGFNRRRPERIDLNPFAGLAERASENNLDSRGNGNARRATLSRPISPSFADGLGGDENQSSSGGQGKRGDPSAQTSSSSAMRGGADGVAGDRFSSGLATPWGGTSDVANPLAPNSAGRPSGASGAQPSSSRDSSGSGVSGDPALAGGEGQAGGDPSATGGSSANGQQQQSFITAQSNNLSLDLSKKKNEAITFDQILFSQSRAEEASEGTGGDDDIFDAGGEPSHDPFNSSPMPVLRVTKTPFKRYVLVECRADGLTLLPEGQSIKLSDDAGVRSVVQQVFAHVGRQASQWGRPAPLHRWQPVLLLLVRPEGRENYWRLRFAFIGTNLDVAARAIESDALLEFPGWERAVPGAGGEPPIRSRTR